MQEAAEESVLTHRKMYGSVAGSTKIIEPQLDENEDEYQNQVEEEESDNEKSGWMDSPLRRKRTQWSDEEKSELVKWGRKYGSRRQWTVFIKEVTSSPLLGSIFLPEHLEVHMLREAWKRYNKDEMH